MRNASTRPSLCDPAGTLMATGRRHANRRRWSAEGRIRRGAGPAAPSVRARASVEGALDSAPGVVDPRLRNPSRRNRRGDDAHDALDDVLLVDLLVGEQEQVVARLEREENGLVPTERVLDGGGLQVVRDDDALPAELTTQEVRHDGLRQRRR